MSITCAPGVSYYIVVLVEVEVEVERENISLILSYIGKKIRDHFIVFLDLPFLTRE